MELLILLVQRRGELVSREDIAQHLWGKNVFLDVDHSINVAMRKIRVALRDDPEKPRFVETVVGKGYRFAATVICSNGDSNPQAQPLPSPLGDDPEQPCLIQTLTGKGYRLIAPVAETDLVPEPAPPKPEALALEPAIGTPKFRRWQALMAAAVVLLVVGGWLYWSRARIRPQSAKGKLMLAVLPFENLTGDAGQDYFSDGVTEEMVTQVGNLDPQHLGVIARTSVMYYKNRPQPLQQVGRDLGVQYVLEGSVRRNQDQARISVRLVRAADGTTLWADSFDRHVGDVLSLQSEIARRIGSDLQLQVLGRAHPKPAVPEVVEAYLRGRFELNRPDVRDAARAYFERAIALDPSYAPAYAGLADFYCSRAVRDDEGSEQAWRLAEQYATRALSLDGESAETHTAIAQIKLMHDWDWHAAREHALRALQLNPSSPEAHTVYARYLRTAGNIGEALNQRKQAVALDPFRVDLKEQLTLERYFARDYQIIVAWARQALASDPNDLVAHVELCINLRHLRLFDESVAECNKQLALEGHADWAATYMHEYREHGYDAASLFVARRQLDEILKRPQPDLWELANAYVAAGMWEAALRALFQGLKTHEPGLLQIRVDPDFDSIRNDPRYAELVRRIGFPNE